MKKIRLPFRPADYLKQNKILFLLLFLVSMAAARALTHPPYAVSFYTYEQLQAHMENLTYDDRTGIYTKPEGTDARLDLWRDERTMEWKTFSLVFVPVDKGREAGCIVQLLDRKKDVLNRKLATLSSGKAVFAIDDPQFRGIRLQFPEQSELSFRLRSVLLAGENTASPLWVWAAASVGIWLALAVILTLLWGLKNDPLGRFFGMCAENTEQFVTVLTTTLSTPFPESFRTGIRRILFFCLFGYSYIANVLGVAWELKYSPAQMWTVSLFVLLLCGMCLEGGSDPGEVSKEETVPAVPPAGRPVPVSGSIRFLKLSAFGFVLASLASDVLVNKRYRYTPYGVLFCGVILLFTWRRMSGSSRLMQDAKRGFEALYLLLLAIGCFFHPLRVGVQYMGAFGDEIGMGIFSLYAAVFFLDDFFRSVFQDHSRGSRGKTAGKAGLQLSAAVIAASMVWATQDLVMVVLLCVILAAAGCFWLGNMLHVLKNRQQEDRIKRAIYAVLISACGTLAGGILAVVLRKILFTLPYRLHTDEVLLLGEPVVKELSLKAEVLTKNWRYFFYDAVNEARTFLTQLNLAGNFNVMNIHGTAVIPRNSIVMNLFRYGLPAGILYAAAMLCALVTGVFCGIRKRDFLMTACALLSVLAACTEAMEHPMLSLNYLIFWLAAVRLMAESGSGPFRKTEKL